MKINIVGNIFLHYLLSNTMNKIEEIFAFPYVEQEFNFFGSIPLLEKNLIKILQGVLPFAQEIVWT
jgi:hypothetical protein